ETKRQAQAQQEHCEHQQELYRQQLQGFEREQQQLTQRQKASDRARQELNDLKVGQPTHEQRLTQARKAHETAINTLQAVRQQAYRQSRQTEHDQLARHLQQQDKACADARALQARISTQRQQLQVLFVDTELLKQLKALETELRDVQARQQAVATRLSWDVQPGQSLTLAGKQVSGKNDALLLEDTRIDIPGVGTLDLQPGGSDVAELRREHDRLQDKRSDLLRQLGANSLNQAEQRAEQYRDLKAETDNRQTRLD